MLIITGKNMGSTEYCKNKTNAVLIPSTLMSKDTNWVKHYFQVINYFNIHQYDVFMDFNQEVIEYLMMHEEKMYIIMFSKESGVVDFKKTRQEKEYITNYMYYDAIESPFIIKIPLESTEINMEEIVKNIHEGKYEE